jgi:16S rRNA C967 or C1407 C5-methylase (RsmB/RsmF family)
MSFPSEFTQRLRQDFGADIAEKVLAAIAEGRPPVSIRHNPLKPFAPRAGEPVPWEPLAEWLPERPEFVLDPLWHAGAYYVQEASSMMLGEVFDRVASDLPGPRTVLDLCAAPGGKSTHLLSRMHPDDLLVSNETIRSRAGILLENLTKWGAPNVAVTNQDPDRFAALGPFFDVILVDAPCSGEGLFRKDAAAIAEWSEAAVAHCALRQERILRDIWPALKPGGTLIYSTCTFNREENEARMEALAPFGELIIPFVRALPGIHRGEGFAIAAIRKSTEMPDAAPNPYRGASTLKTVREIPWRETLPDGEWAGLAVGGKTFAVPASHLVRFRALDGHRVMAAGFDMGDERRPAFTAYAPSATDRIRDWEAPDLRTALLYLKRESIPVDGPNGLLRVLWKGAALGFGKVVNGRLNNQYPMDWRIRRSI